MKRMMKEERVRSPLSPRRGHCRPFASFNGSPGSFEQAWSSLCDDRMQERTEKAPKGTVVCRSGTTTTPRRRVSIKVGAFREDAGTRCLLHFKVKA